MTSASIHRALLGLLITLLGVACSDHRIPAVSPGLSTTKLRVKSITHLTGLPENQVKVSQFQYDDRGRLLTVIAYQVADSSQGPVERNTYQYDGQNRLIQHKRIITRPLSYKGTTEQHHLTYNSVGLIDQITYANDIDSPGTLKLIYTYQPQFNHANKLTSSAKITSQTFFQNAFPDYLIQADVHLSAIQFTGDNLTSYHFQNTFATGSLLNIVDSDNALTYDDKINPFYGIYLIPLPLGYIQDIRNGFFFYPAYYGGLDNLLIASRNNVLTETTSNAPSLTTYAYTYNGAGLPLTRIKKILTNAASVEEKLRFEFESY